MLLVMRHVVRSLVCSAMIPLMWPSQLSANQAHQQPTTAELLRILRITTMRVRMPRDSRDVWSLTVLKRDQVKPKGTNPATLTERTGLLSLREKGNDSYEFTLPEKNGAYSQGDFDLCRETACAGQYSLKWLKHPVYSIDGTQCLLAEFSNLGDEEVTGYLALVVARSRP
jgi:hypothetical protein